MPSASFVIAGVQKGGTTALHHFLAQHPDIFMPASKELHFFDDEAIDWSAPDYGAYERHFDGAADGQLCGEATPIYCYWPPSLERIARYRPSMKIIVILRDPVRRAFSHWKMESGRGWDRLDFSAAIREGRRRGVEDTASRHGCHRIFGYVDRSLYAPQVARILEWFPRRQVLFLTNDQMRADLQATMDRVFSFVGVEPMPFEAAPEIHPPTPGRAAAALSAPDEDYLRHLFADDVRMTASLTGLDLAAWM